MRLRARSEAEAKSEADVLDRKLDKAFFEKRKQAGVPFERDAHYDSWSRSHNKLRRPVVGLARLKATTHEGLNLDRAAPKVDYEGHQANGGLATHRRCRKGRASPWALSFYPPSILSVE